MGPSANWRQTSAGTVQVFPLTSYQVCTDEKNGSLEKPTSYFATPGTGAQRSCGSSSGLNVAPGGGASSRSREKSPGLTTSVIGRETNWFGAVIRNSSVCGP